MELLTVHEAARLLKVTPLTVRRYIAAGRLPAVRVGRRVRVRKEALEGFEPPTAEELERRKLAVARILALRDQIPSIAPMTAAELVRLAREEEGSSYDPGE